MTLDGAEDQRAEPESYAMCELPITKVLLRVLSTRRLIGTAAASAALMPVQISLSRQYQSHRAKRRRHDHAQHDVHWQ
jgi:hypothetical protein